MSLLPRHWWWRVPAAATAATPVPRPAFVQTRTMPSPPPVATAGGGLRGIARRVSALVPTATSADRVRSFPPSPPRLPPVLGDGCLTAAGRAAMHVTGPSCAPHSAVTKEDDGDDDGEAGSAVSLVRRFLYIATSHSWMHPRLWATARVRSSQNASYVSVSVFTVSGAERSRKNKVKNTLEVFTHISTTV